MDAARFINEIVPVLARERGKQFPLLAAPISFAVDADAWTLTLHDDAKPTRQGGDPAAAFTVWFTNSAFEQLMAGTLDAARAVATRSIGVRGDLHVLEQLGRFLQGAGHAGFARGGP